MSHVNISFKIKSVYWRSTEKNNYALNALPNSSFEMQYIEMIAHTFEWTEKVLSSLMSYKSYSFLVFFITIFKVKQKGLISLVSF